MLLINYKFRSAWIFTRTCCIKIKICITTTISIYNKPIVCIICDIVICYRILNWKSFHNCSIFINCLEWQQCCLISWTICIFTISCKVIHINVISCYSVAVCRGWICCSCFICCIEEVIICSNIWLICLSAKVHYLPSSCNITPCLCSY